MQKKVIVSIILIFCFLIAQSEQQKNDKDSKFIVLKTGEQVKSGKTNAIFKIQPIVEFGLTYSDKDSIEHDISDINKIIDNDGKTITKRKTLLIINTLLKGLNFSSSLIIWYLILK